MALPTAAQKAEPTADHWAAPWAAEMADLWANWTAEWSAVLMASKRAAPTAAWMAASKAGSKEETTAVSSDWSWADYLAARWADPKVDPTVTKKAARWASLTVGR